MQTKTSKNSSLSSERKKKSLNEINLHQPTDTCMASELIAMFSKIAKTVFISIGYLVTLKTERTNELKISRSIFRKFTIRKLKSRIRCFIISFSILEI